MSENIIIKNIGDTMPNTTLQAGKMGSLVLTDNNVLGTFQYDSLHTMVKSQYPITEKITQGLSVNSSISYSADSPYNSRVLPHPDEDDRFLTITTMYSGSQFYTTLTMYKIDNTDEATQGTVIKVTHINLTSKSNSHARVLNVRLIGDTLFVPIRKPDSSDRSHQIHAIKVNKSSFEHKIMKNFDNHSYSSSDFSLHIDGKKNEDGTFSLMYTYQHWYYSSYATTQQDADSALTIKCHFVDYNWTTNAVVEKICYDMITSGINDNVHSLVYNKIDDCFYIMLLERGTIEPRYNQQYNQFLYCYDLVKIKLDKSKVLVNPQPCSFVSNSASIYDLLINDECTAMFVAGYRMFTPNINGGIPIPRQGIMQIPINSSNLTEPTFYSVNNFVSSDYINLQQVGNKLIYSERFTSYPSYKRNLCFARLVNGRIVNSNLSMRVFSGMTDSSSYCCSFATKNGKYQGVFSISNSANKGAEVGVIFSKGQDKPVYATGLNYGLLLKNQDILLYGKYTCDDIIKAKFPDGEIITGQYYSWDGNGKIIKSSSKAKILGLTENKIFLDA